MKEAIAKLEERVARLEAIVKQGFRPDRIVLDKEHDRIMRRMDTINGTYAGMQTWSRADTDEFRRLRKRRDEIRELLGVRF